jgi:alanine-glyoxylate transaminase/serine-glyoxylate transaminase/serine-pyruvate transaminase
LGDVPSLDEVRAALKERSYKVVTVTHVDTSTGVLTDVKSIAALAQEHGALSIVDGVCATGGEELRQEDWGVDIALTGSQKALGVPPGLAILLASHRAMDTWKKRKAPVPSMFADFAQWLPIMEAYAADKAMYFATPAVNLVAALDVSLGHLLAEGMNARFARHKRHALAMRAAFEALGLRSLPVREGVMAHTLSALYFPNGVDAALVGRVRDEGVVIAGGLHPAAKTKYFRVGHMGALTANDMVATVGAVERGLAQLGYSRLGQGVAALQALLAKTH